MHLAFRLFLSVQQLVDLTLLSQTPLWLQIPVVLFGFGGFIQFLRWIINWRKTTGEIDQQGHTQNLEQRQVEAEFRDELRNRIDYLTSVVEKQDGRIDTLNDRINKLEGACRELIWVAKHERWHVRRALHRVDDLREELGREPLTDEEREEYHSERFHEVMSKSPFGDMRGFASEKKRPAHSKDMPRTPAKDELSEQ